MGTHKNQIIWNHLTRKRKCLAGCLTPSARDSTSMTQKKKNEKPGLLWDQVLEVKKDFCRFRFEHWKLGKTLGKKLKVFENGKQDFVDTLDAIKTAFREWSTRTCGSDHYSEPVCHHVNYYAKMMTNLEPGHHLETKLDQDWEAAKENNAKKKEGKKNKKNIETEQ